VGKIFTLGCGNIFGTWLAEMLWTRYDNHGKEAEAQMTKNEAIKIAIKAVRKYATEHYGWDAKFHEDKKREWDKYMETIHVLETIKDGGD
jgi:hypothetical protein